MTSVAMWAGGLRDRVAGAPRRLSTLCCPWRAVVCTALRQALIPLTAKWRQAGWSPEHRQSCVTCSGQRQASRPLPLASPAQQDWLQKLPQTGTRLPSMKSPYT